MPADASIFGLVQQPKARNPLEDMAQVMQIQHAMGANAVNDYTLRKAAREDADTNALSGVYKNAVGADGKIDRAKARTLAAQNGLGARIPGMDKAFAETDEAEAKLQTQKLAAVKQRTELTGQAAGWLRANPTPENANRFFDHLVQNGIIAPEQAAQGKAMVASGASVQELADLSYRTALGTKEQLAKYETRNTGGTTDTLRIDPVSGANGVVSSVQNTASPADVLAHQDRVATRQQAERHFNQAVEDGKTQILQTDNGPILVNKANGTSKPVTTPDGQQVRTPPKALTDAQAKANLFGTRMKEADRILGDLEGKYSPGAVNTKMAAGELPLVGGVAGYVGNKLLSDDGQSAEQAQRDFINAVLRRESGATIQPSEFANAQKQYFPQQGDSKQVLAQKRANRALAIKGLEAEVPQGFRTSPTLTSAVAGADIDALLSKYK